MSTKQITVEVGKIPRKPETMYVCSSGPAAIAAAAARTAVEKGGASAIRVGLGGGGGKGGSTSARRVRGLRWGKATRVLKW